MSIPARMDILLPLRFLNIPALEEDIVHTGWVSHYRNRRYPIQPGHKANYIFGCFIATQKDYGNSK